METGTVVTKKPLNENQTLWKVTMTKDENIVKEYEVEISDCIRLVDSNIPCFPNPIDLGAGKKIEFAPVPAGSWCAVFSTETEHPYVNMISPYDFWIGKVSSFEDEKAGRIKLYDWLYDRFVNIMQAIHKKEPPYDKETKDFSSPEEKDKFIGELIIPVVQFEIQRKEISDAIQKFVSENPKFVSMRIFLGYQPKHLIPTT